jgi:hypothetical protein
METEPGNPPQRPADDKPISELGDGSPTADGGHDAIVMVRKRSKRPPRETCHDLRRRVSG